jgi:tRNA(fMet)-specific endonuclease VapC
MNGRFLLDTNIIIDLFNGDEKVINWLKKSPEVYIPNIAVGELYYGAYRSGKKKDNLKKINEFIISSAIVNTDVDTSRLYGNIKNHLKIKGNPVPENDIWIAALGLQYDLTLVTRDKHFKEIDSIKAIIW